MISVDSNIQNIFKNNTAVNINTGCVLEYNMNLLVDNPVVTSPNGYLTRVDVNGNTYQPFKKLFPLDTVIKTFRPAGAGIKYAISGDVLSNTYQSSKSTQYPIDYRTYYAGADTLYKYWVTIVGQGADITITYPKTIITNKIVAKFELSHSTPGSWVIYGNGSQLATGTSIKPFTTTVSSVTTKNYDAGNVTIYYTGSTWTTDESLHNTSANVSLTSVRLTTPAVSGKYIGVIELSPRWVVDVSDRISGLSIDKESSMGSEELMPVGIVSANSLSLDMVSYESDRTVISFDKTYTFSTSKIYLYKMVEVRPYFKVYSSSGTLSDSAGLYTKIPQGVFYIDSWSTGEFGDVRILALDSAKILQTTIAPNVLCEGHSAAAIIRRLLDACGFTNYNINIKTTSGVVTDTSLITPRYWWSDDRKMVWDAIKEICRDTQMVACFDEYNVLQFYTRDFLFDSTRSNNWAFTYDTDGTTLPNISSMSKKDLPSANQIVIQWNNVVTSNYEGNAQPLYKGSNTTLGALSLEQNLLTTDVSTFDSNKNYITTAYVKLQAITVDSYDVALSLNSFSGFLVIDSEIIEYDGIEYEYRSLTDALIKVLNTSQADVLKSQALAKPGEQNNYPTGRYRIKARGSFGTTVANHYANAQGIIDQWSGYEVTWL